MKKWNYLIVIIWMVISISSQNVYSEGDGTNPVNKKYFNLDENDLAMQGYDGVEYLDNQQAVKGKEDYVAIHNGVRYYFVNEQNRKTFEGSPEKYVPAYGGWCAFGLGMQDNNGFSADKYAVDPQTFKVTGGRVHLFYNVGNYNALDYWEKDSIAIQKRAKEFWADEISGENLQKKLARGFHPNAPAEMTKIAFLVGEFECHGKFQRPDGSYSTSRSFWRGQYHFNGRAFMDDWWNPQTGNIGTTWRTYDKKNKRWACIWLQAGTDKIPSWPNDYFYGNFNEQGDFVLLTEHTDTQGQDYKSRVAFTDITEKGFTWKMDTSYDGGETWTENVRLIKATRIR